MAANTIPVTPKVQNVSAATVATANTALDGTGTMVTVFTAGADGSRVDQIRVANLGTNVASVMRFFVNTGAINDLIHEVTLPSNTISQVASSILIDITIPKNTSETACPIPYLKAGQKINVTVGTTGAAGWKVVVHGADY